jgi:hypothetical protein
MGFYIVARKMEKPRPDRDQERGNYLIKGSLVNVRFLTVGLDGFHRPGSDGFSFIGFG